MLAPCLLLFATVLSAPPPSVEATNASSAQDASETALATDAARDYHQAQLDEKAGKTEFSFKEYQSAAENYDLYLWRFPNAPDAYDLRFAYGDCLLKSLDYLGAAKQLLLVRDANPTGPHAQEAAAEAIDALEQELRSEAQSGRIPLRPALTFAQRRGAPAVAVPLPVLVRQYVDALDWYAAHDSQAEDAPRFAYAAGLEDYRYDRLDEARGYFQQVMANYPSSKEAKAAAAFVIETYLAAHDWKSAEEQAGALAAEACAADAKANTCLTLTRDKLIARAEGARELLAQGDCESAGAKDLEIADELQASGTPASDPEARALAIDSLRQASAAAAQCHRADAQEQIAQRLATQFPESLSMPTDGGIFPSGVEDGGALDAGLGAAEVTDAGLPPSTESTRSAPVSAKGCELRFLGNIVLAEEVYRAVLDLPIDAPPDEETATLVRRRLETFLHRSGYELATVVTRVRGRVIAIAIDEGRLEKIVYVGNLNLNTLRFQLGLQLPYEIFNRPELDRQITKLTRELGLGRVWYKLVPTKEVKHLGPQLDKLMQVQGYDLVHPQEAYELHIFFTEKAWDTGAWLDLRTSNQDGFEVIGTWQGEDAYLPDDRYRLSTSGGLGIRREIYNGNFYPTFSRAYGEAVYFLPVPRLRPLLEARSELTSRQRPDLGLESYYNLFVDTLLSVQYELARKQTFTFGLGTRYQTLFGETPWYDEPTPTQLQNLFSGATSPHTGECPASVPIQDCLPNTATTPIRALRPFAEARLYLLFDDGHDRPDRRSDLMVEAREFLPINEPQFGEARANWQRVIPFGWHDLWLQASGAWIWGDVPFNNEEPINGHVRNVFSDLYVHKVVSEATEFRFSITRDIFKFGFFNDVAVFSEITSRALDASYDTESAAIADCFGPGFHALIEGVFQVDLYYSVGWTTAHNLPYRGAPGNEPGINSNNPHFDTGFNLGLQKVF